MTGARTAVALYVAVALHAVALLFLLLAPLPQTGPGDGIGLSLAGSGTVLAAPGRPSVRPAREAPVAPPASIPRPTSPAKPTGSRLVAPETATVAAPGRQDPPTDTTTSARTGDSSMTPAPGNGGPGDTAGHRGGGGADGYFARLRTHLAAFRREVPDAAIGRAEVRFTVLADGRVAELILERSSGSERLDAEALALITRAQPLPLPPRGEPLRVRVPVYAGAE